MKNVVTNRFRIVHYIGENLTPEEVIKHKNDVKKVKIQDITEELPDLIVENEEIAKKYIAYMNTKTPSTEINDVFDKISSKLDNLNYLNYELLKPEREIIGYTEDEWDDEKTPIYSEIPLNDKLWFQGYNSEVDKYRKSIVDELNKLKKTMIK